MAAHSPMPRQQVFNILIVGDVLIPARAARIPPKIKEKLQPDRIDMVVSTGGLNAKPVLDYFKTLASEVLAAKSPLDEFQAPEIAQKQLFGPHGLKLGVTNGHQVVPQSDVSQLTKVAAKLGLDVVCASGEYAVEETAGVIIIRPGSMTGIYGNPSFCLLSTDGCKMTVYNYQLVGEELQVKQVDVVRRFEGSVAREDMSSTGDEGSAGEDPPAWVKKQNVDNSSSGERSVERPRRKKVSLDSSDSSLDGPGGKKALESSDE